MCALYTITFQLPELLSYFAATPSPILDGFEWKNPVAPTTRAPVLAARDGQTMLVPMQFSLIPSWSKERRPKFATYNARFDALESKASWKKPFLKQRCVVPITSFFEPVREGPYAGNVISFNRNDKKLLLAAGVYDIWKDPASGEKVLSFAIITEDAAQFINSCGHDRQPLFLKDESVGAWLSRDLQDAAGIKELALSQREAPELEVKVERALKS